MLRTVSEKIGTVTNYNSNQSSTDMFLSKKLANNVKHKITPSILTIFGLAFTGCQSISNNSIASAQSKPKIVVSHNVLCDFVETIAQDTVELTCLIEKGQDPHTFRPAPSHRKAIEKAQAVFYGGYDLEPKIAEILKPIAKKKPVIAVHEEAVSNPIITKAHHHEETEEGHEEHGHEEHGHEEHGHEEHGHEEEKAETAPDPHVWHDVDNAIAIVKYLHSSLLKINPAQADIYVANTNSLLNNLTQLHPWIQDQVATIPEGKKILVTTHNSLNYFVQGYEFDEYETLQGLNPEDSPSAQDLKKLVQTIKAKQIPTVFAENTAEDRVIKNVAKEANITLSDRKLWVDGLGEEGSKTDSYTKMMIYNTCTIAEGLGGSCQPFSGNQ